MINMVNIILLDVWIWLSSLEDLNLLWQVLKLLTDKVDPFEACVQSSVCETLDHTLDRTPGVLCSGINLALLPVA